MAYDAEPSVEVTARDRMIRLRDFLADLPDEKFDMSDFLVWEDGPCLYNIPIGEAVNMCGTAACIAGWAQALFYPSVKQDEDLAQEALGLSEKMADALFLPPNSSSPEYTRARAVAVLDHYLATGEIDWSVAK